MGKPGRRPGPVRGRAGLDADRPVTEPLDPSGIPPPQSSPMLRLVGLSLAAIVVSGAALTAAQEPGAEPPPMYLAEPFERGFAGMPLPVSAEQLPTWPRWFAGAGGLVMTRTLPAGAPTMQPLGGVQLTTSDASATWPGGLDLHVGRWIGPRQKHAVELVYWGVYGIGSTAGLLDAAAGIDAIPQAPGATIGGVPAGDLLASARGQSIARADVINNVEVNWIYALGDRPEFQPRDRRLSLMWLAGFRFFQVNDVLTLTSLPDDTALQPAELSVATNNNLYGGQVGAKFDWRFLPTVRFNVVPKFLLAGNAITDTTTLGDTSGAIGVLAGGAPARVHSELGVFSWLGSVDTGLAWDVTDHWSLSLGYRVVGVGNIAQADGQWPAIITTPASLDGIAAGSSTIVHGAFAGFEARY
jgi:hypothetical protein